MNSADEKEKEKLLDMFTKQGARGHQRQPQMQHNSFMPPPPQMMFMAPPPPMFMPQYAFRPQQPGFQQPGFQQPGFQQPIPIQQSGFQAGPPGFIPTQPSYRPPPPQQMVQQPNFVPNNGFRPMPGPTFVPNNRPPGFGQPQQQGFGFQPAQQGFGFQPQSFGGFQVPNFNMNLNFGF